MLMLVGLCFSEVLSPRWVDQPSKHKRKVKLSLCLCTFNEAACDVHHFTIFKEQQREERDIYGS